MITYIQSSIFTSPAEVLVNTVNTQGVMGKGIALKFKKLFPEMFVEYQKHCEEGRLKPGVLMYYRTPGKSVLNFPTKTSWRRPSKIEYIQEGLEAFVSAFSQLGIQSIAFPQLGCGNGDLDWESTVKPVMERYLNPLPIRVFVHIHQHEYLPEHLTAKQMKAWLHGQPYETSGIEAWSDLVAQVNSGVDGWYVDRKELWSHGDTIVEQDVLNHIDKSGSTHILGQEDFFVFWRTLRTNGVALPSDIPPHLNLVSDSFVQLMSHLPYLEEVGVQSARTPDYVNGVQFRIIPGVIQPALIG